MLLKKLTDGLFGFARTASGALFLVAIAINFANIVGRYVFFTPIFWAEEVIVFDIVWCVLLGAALVCREGEHLHVEVLETFLSKRAVTRLRLAIWAVVCVVALATAYYGLRVVELIGGNNQRSVVAEIPMAIPYAAIPVGFLLIVVAGVAKFAQLLKAIGRGAPDEAAPRQDGSGAAR
jgi:TRAP-type C4-dicarboxylate transport system permease small subunit